MEMDAEIALPILRDVAQVPPRQSVGGGKFRQKRTLVRFCPLKTTALRDKWLLATPSKTLAWSKARPFGPFPSFDSYHGRTLEVNLQKDSACVHCGLRTETSRMAAPPALSCLAGTSGHVTGPLRGGCGCRVWSAGVRHEDPFYTKLVPLGSAVRPGGHLCWVT